MRALLVLLMVASIAAPRAHAADAPAAPSVPAAGTATSGKSGARAAAAPVATRALVARLEAAGRGEVRLTQTTPDPTGGPARVDRGTLALEPPDRARIDYSGAGEALTARADGGEWLQPAARQMLRLDPEQAAEAARIWAILVGGGESFFERRLGVRRYALLPRELGAAAVDSAWIEVDAAGLPTRADLFSEALGKVTVVFAGWKFGRPRGDTAFRLSAPQGYEVVALP